MRSGLMMPLNSLQRTLKFKSGGLLASCMSEVERLRVKAECYSKADGWGDHKSRACFLREVGVAEGYKDPSDWSRMDRATLEKYSMRGLSDRYYDNIASMLADSLNKDEFFPWLFTTQRTFNWWDDDDYVYAFTMWLGWTKGNNLDIFEQVEWYALTEQDIFDAAGYGGRLLLERFGSMYGLLSETFNEFSWTSRLCNGYVEDTELREKIMVAPARTHREKKALFKMLATYFNCETLDDWATVSRRSVTDLVGYKMFSPHSTNSVIAMARTIGGLVPKTRYEITKEWVDTEREGSVAAIRPARGDERNYNKRHVGNKKRTNCKTLEDHERIIQDFIDKEGRFPKFSEVSPNTYAMYQRRGYKWSEVPALFGL